MSAAPEKQKRGGNAICQVHETPQKKQRTTTSTSFSSEVTCTAVEVQEIASEACDVCELATGRLFHMAKPWHVQALLADFGVQTDGTPAELARRLAHQLVRQ